MPRYLGAGAWAVVCTLLIAQGQPALVPDGKRMSIHNRILLNRLAVSGHTSVQVMLAVDESRLDGVAAVVARLFGRVRRIDRAIGYMRVEVPLDALTAIVNEPSVVAYQISSLSRGAWYRDGPPQSNAEMFRDREAGPAAGSERPPPKDAELPALSPEDARAPGDTADDAGVGQWLSEHPTFDGRGVTIAFLESGQPEFTHATLSSAKTLEGRETSKIAGILDSTDPDEPDETRVELNAEVRARSGWCRIGGRTFIVPHPGSYRFGVFSLPAGHNLVQEFAVLEDEASGEIRVDTDGDADFRDEPPLPDVNTRFEPHALRLRYPRQTELAFVVARGRDQRRLHVYTSNHGHSAMTVSVAAGSRTDDGLAYGVAPAARVLLVRNLSADQRLHEFFEGYLDAAKRPDVDILSDSMGLYLVPDTASDFAGVFFNRLIAVYGKPVFHGAGNSPQLLGNVSALGRAFSVGGSIGPATFSALFGGATLPETIVHPLSAAGPALDGLFKPDFIAPVHRIAADAVVNETTTLVPKNAPTARLPRGYVISCCTSASGPYAAGVAALLLSAAKQQGLSYSVESLGRALSAGAHFLASEPAHVQGAGTVDVRGAWRELQHADANPRIRVSGPNVHALTAYAARGAHGAGLYEREGWTRGMTAKRVIQFTRESGPQDAVSYRLNWTGNDGTFTAPPFVSLPLNQPISVPLTIDVASSGVHSAILNLRDPATDVLAARTMATIVAAQPLDTSSQSAQFTGVVPLMRDKQLYVSVPDAAGAIDITLEVIRGSLTALILPSDGMIRDYYFHVMPAASRTFTPGRYRVTLPHPAAGVWSVTLMNDSAWREPNPALVSTGEAQYAVSVRLLSASLAVQSTSVGSAVLDVTNVGAPVRETAVDVSVGTLRSHAAETGANGLPNRFAIDVPAGASTLALDLHAANAGATLELHLYDCSSGECFSYAFTAPAARDQSIVVRDPHPGRWIAAVNTAPYPSTRDEFVVDEITVRHVDRQPSASNDPHAVGARWTEIVNLPRARLHDEDGTAIALLELIDAAAERDCKAHPWETRPGTTNFADRPAVIGRAILRLK